MQKSRDKNLNLGDSNSRYFYSLIKSNRKRMNIHTITDNKRVSYSTPNQIESVIVDHFRGILARKNLLEQQSSCLEHIQISGKLNNDDISQLCKPISIEEIELPWARWF